MNISHLSCKNFENLKLDGVVCLDSAKLMANNFLKLSALRGPDFEKKINVKRKQFNYCWNPTGTMA
jgi:hypothetical protein